MEYSVEFQNVSKRYILGGLRRSLRQAIPDLFRSLMGRTNVDWLSELWALKDVSFAVSPGSSLGIMGPNGAGKTTILKLLANISHPTSGLVKCRGRISALIELGAGFHPDLSGRENIFLNGAILGLSRAEVNRLFDRIVQFSGLEKFIDTPVKRYSSGMYVRLGFSIAAHIHPDVLLVDEVLSVGDVQFRSRCNQRIDELKKNGTTILFVSHSPYQIKSVCDRGLFLANGQIQGEGDVIEAISAYEAWQRKSQEQETQDVSIISLDTKTSPSVEIRQVEVCYPDGSRPDEFDYLSPVDVRVHYRVAQPFRQPNLIVRILRSDGVPCWEVRAQDHGYTLPDLEGEGVISLMIDPMQLTGGVYVARAEIEGSLGGVSLAMTYSPWFRVSGLSVEPSEWRGVFVPRLTSIRVTKDSGFHSEND